MYVTVAIDGKKSLSGFNSESLKKAIYLSRGDASIILELYY